MVFKSLTFNPNDPDLVNARPGSPSPFFYLMSRSASSSSDVWCNCWAPRAASAHRSTPVFQTPAPTGRSPMAHDVPGQFDATRSNANVARQSEETTNQVKFREPMDDDTDAEALLHNEGESPGADDDPLPAIDCLQISGDAFPGRELQACGYSVNGATSCFFEVPIS
ncbi:hypothetical protein CDL15_Pgr020873 [Punica granatum]|uniref:Uncharacterized protein n=1 Tax=Punica granatum TaxID=22663 RepID=A0A218XWD5_PUNGR|nr:hypothetical protein CDL15_Pgr020873 [Punica granatum]